MGISVQFRDKDSVLTAYEDRGVPPFAIFQGKQFLFSFRGDNIDEGREYLQKILDMIDHSAAIYTLCVYEDLRDGEKIKNTTPHDGSFNFRFNEYQPSEARALGMPGNSFEVYELKKEIKELKETIEELKNSDEEEETTENKIIGTIERVMNIPGINDLILNFVGALKPKQNITAIGAAPGEEEKAQKAFSELAEKYPIFADKVIYLRRLMDEDPKKLESLLSYLNLLG